MNRSIRTARAATMVRAVTVGACAVAVPLLAGCDSSGAVDASPTAAEAAASVETEAALIDDPELKRHLATFDGMVEIDGYAVPAGELSPVDSVESFMGSGTDVYDPAACSAFHQATALTTAEDLTAAAGDIVNPVGPFFPGGEPPEDEPEHVVWILTRAFADEELAATLYPALLDADCTTYSWETTWEDGSTSTEHEVAEVAEEQLDGVDGTTMRVTFAGGTSTLYDAAGEVDQVGERGPWNHYVHVDGPYAIMIDAVGIDDEQAVIAQIIGDFVEHMDAG
ncbi:hypothetical protein [Demequina rhizosphaerae]|uniref:hypothetical protein n=1 Tax=Demequina rhizosphaerae TaxID=1638985 RepID=UPI0007818B75|nr:hypothetical protein [Demequina rhizosphaerae]